MSPPTPPRPRTQPAQSDPSVPPGRGCPRTRRFLCTIALSRWYFYFFPYRLRSALVMSRGHNERPAVFLTNEEDYQITPGVRSPQSSIHIFAGAVSFFNEAEARAITKD